VSGSGASYTVKISGITGVSTLGLNLVDDNSIRDLAGNPLTTKNAAASFAPQQAYKTGLGPDTAELSDFNLEGTLDIVATNAGNNFVNTVSVLLGNGDGMFQHQVVTTNAVRQVAEAVGDINADGKPDLIVANATSNTVSVLIGKGDSTFLAPMFLSTGWYPSAVVIGDCNADGKVDIAVTNEYSNSVSLFLGNGDGTFQSQRTFAVGRDPAGVANGDINADGSLDLAVTNYSGSSVSVFPNTGNGSFTGQTTTVRVGNVYTVTSVGDSGPGSLRQAIVNANTHSGPDTIQFAIVGANKAITLSSALPAITGVVAIDGSTQAGVSVVGSRMSSAVTGLAFAAAASESYAVGTLPNTVVQGNTITNNRGSGVLMDNARGITIGLTAEGAGVANTIVNNSGFGLRAWGTSTGSAVRRNIISGNNVDVQIAAAKGLTYVPLAVNRARPASHPLSASSGPVRLLNGPKTGPSTVCAHHRHSCRPC